MRTARATPAQPTTGSLSTAPAQRLSASWRFPPGHGGAHGADLQQAHAVLDAALAAPHAPVDGGKHQGGGDLGGGAPSVGGAVAQHLPQAATKQQRHLRAGQAGNVAGGGGGWGASRRMGWLQVRQRGAAVDDHLGSTRDRSPRMCAQAPCSPGLCTCRQTMAPLGEMWHSSWGSHWEQQRGQAPPAGAGRRPGRARQLSRLRPPPDWQRWQRATPGRRGPQHHGCARRPPVGPGGHGIRPRFLGRSGRWLPGLPATLRHRRSAGSGWWVKDRVGVGCVVRERGGGLEGFGPRLGAAAGAWRGARCEKMGGHQGAKAQAQRSKPVWLLARRPGLTRRVVVLWADVAQPLEVGQHLGGGPSIHQLALCGGWGCQGAGGASAHAQGEHACAGSNRLHEHPTQDIQL